MTRMAVGQTKRMRNRKMPKKQLFFSVPQLVNSSFTNCLDTYHPKNRHVRNPPNGRKICPVTKSNNENRFIEPTDRKSQSPNDSEQKAPMMEHVTVTMVAALLRVRCNSSWKKAVLTSCRDISDVNAANDSNA